MLQQQHEVSDKFDCFDICINSDLLKYCFSVSEINCYEKIEW